MLSKAEAGKKIGGDSSNNKLLSEIEAISKALYRDSNLSKNLYGSTNTQSKSSSKTKFLPNPNSKLKDTAQDPSNKDKRSIWNWKPLRAFSHIRHRRFNCCFSLQVHSIEGLSSDFDNLSLSVYWKRRDGVLTTRPLKVFQGIVEFEEQLSYTCSVYGSRSGPHHSAKYEAKHFLLYASLNGAPDLDLGKHRVDLTRLLPLTLEELEEEKSSGKWTTSFKLSGKAKGATMNVSFGYKVVGDNSHNSTVPSNRQNVIDTTISMQKNRNSEKSEMKFGRLKSNQRSLASSRSIEDIKDLHEVLPLAKLELARSVDVLYQKLDEEKLDISVDYNPQLDEFTEHLEPIKPNSCGLSENDENSSRDEFSLIEQRVDVPLQEQVESEKVDLKVVDSTSIEHLDVEGLSLSCEEAIKIEHLDDGEHDCIHIDEPVGTKESLMKDLELALDCVSDLEKAATKSHEDQENYMDVDLNNEEKENQKSQSLDEDFAAEEFLSMLGIENSPFYLNSESEPESPRERLLRQFEEESLAKGCSLFDFGIGDENQEYGPSGTSSSEWGNLAYETDHQMSKRKAKMLEDLETEVLMHEWGLNEKAFQHSPPSNSNGFGSPIDLPNESPLELPPLGEGLGPFIQTKDGGYLRSMNPSIFSNAKSGGSLIMQVSSPVVVPAEMGSGVMEILQGLASVGMEKLSMQANKLMPLEDITGKTMHQVAWEAAPSLEGLERQCLLQNESVIGHDTFDGQRKVKGISSGHRSTTFSSNNSVGNEIGQEYVSLEDLAPLAMDKIEALSMEGLRIQSGMSDEEAPSNISAQSIREFSALQGKGVNISGSLDLDGAAGLQLLDVKDSGDISKDSGVTDEGDGIMGLSLTLDEWMRLDSGELNDEEYASEHTSKILAAHHAKSLDSIRGNTKGDRKRGKGSSRKCGLLGNNFTVALMVQLRDPLRNYELVGAPMLALIQVERVFIPPKPKIYGTVSQLKISSEEDDESESKTGKEIEKEPKEEKASEEEGIPKFKITEVHVAGIKTEPSKKLWGNSTQQKSGSRWLLANGMGKSNKHPFMKSKVASKSSGPETTKVQPGDTLWSISSRVHGDGNKWKELVKLNPHIRNPNVTFPNETIRLR